MKEAREAAHLSQAELGQRLESLLGKKWWAQAVSAAEKGRREFTVEELVALALCLDMKIQDLFWPPDNVDEIEFPAGPHPVRADSDGRPQPTREPGPEELLDAIRRTTDALAEEVRAMRERVEQMERTLKARKDEAPRARREAGPVRMVGDRMVPIESKTRAAKAISRGSKSRSKRVIRKKGRR